MEKTVCEMFAGVGGFRCGLNAISTIEDAKKPEKWNTVWFSQWEPADKTTQWAHSCYTNRFGTCLDSKGQDTTNWDINKVDKSLVPGHSLLVGGFPCQDYSVAASASTSKGIEGKKGVLWWDIRDMLEAKEAPFVLLENVDRLVKSPASQRGRDFSIMLACFRDLDYTVEWRIINAAEYGYQQRRRRIFIFAYKNNTKYASKIVKDTKYSKHNNIEKIKDSIDAIILKKGFFAKSFPASKLTEAQTLILPSEVGEISQYFSFLYENTGVMKDGIVYTVKTKPEYNGKQITLGDILEKGEVEEKYFVKDDAVYYTNHDVRSSNEMEERLSKEDRHTWQYLKGGKRFPRMANTGFEYAYSEGPIPLFDEWDLPARTMLTSEGSFNRSTHLVKDKLTGKPRLLTAAETERIQGFPTDWTKECLVDDKIVEMPLSKRRFMMGNALVVDLVKQMEPQLAKIIDNE